MTTDEIINALNNLNEMVLTVELDGLKYRLEEHSDHRDLVKKVFDLRNEDELHQEIEARESAEEELSVVESDLVKANKTIQEIKNLLN